MCTLNNWNFHFITWSSEGQSAILKVGFSLQKFFVISLQHPKEIRNNKKLRIVQIFVYATFSNVCFSFFFFLSYLVLILYCLLVFFLAVGSDTCMSSDTISRWGLTFRIKRWTFNRRQIKHSLGTSSEIVFLAVKCHSNLILPEIRMKK